MIATKKILAALIVISLVAVPVAAQTTATGANTAPKIRAFIILGKGIAASPSDPMDFMIVKFGLARFLLPNGTEVARGILKLDEEKYRLREVTVEDGHASGKIYSNGTEVGSFDVSSVMKGNTEVWAGTMELNGNAYNLYVIEGSRPIKAGELKEKIIEYCRNNPDENCKGKIYNYCMNNPNDRRCRALFRAYCLRGHMDDARCREEFVKWCNEHPDNKYCVPFVLKRARVYCEKHSDSVLCRKIAQRVVNYCRENPDNAGCAEVKRVIKERPKLFQRLKQIRARIQALKVTAPAVETPNVTKTEALSLPLSSEVGGE